MTQFPLARALIAAPDWLFLDEAFSALDETAAATLLTLLRDRLPGAQIVSVTHQGTLQNLHPRRATFVDRDGRRRLSFVETDAHV